MNWRGTFGAVLLAGSAFTASWAASDPFDDARHHVVNKENAEALRLVDSGQFSVDQPNYEGWTLLHYAAEAGNLEMVKALLERGADATLKTKWGSTPGNVASATMIKAVLLQAVQRRQGVGPTATRPVIPTVRAPSSPARPAGTVIAKSKAPSVESKGELACNRKWKADYDLCSDTTCKMTTYRKHAQCSKTGRYW
ncbi:ankyrin repeat domain-containing protein [Sphingomonas sp. RP10(2022)]|uniref:Ankyrin repeat domain-containing protein n=1 Tax=Sphingomonas liriopis TaxID=2949094 RepID=A0A9X2HPZ7_9SPHN|nr:ankyrin repeat domain-containing protein [Sphingomonas liriopis]MCP3734327.1 ankyrin repeat domain-containing protein [Sphingomonas liriopis]